MPARDLKSQVDFVSSLAPAVYDAKDAGEGVDLTGFNSAMVVIVAGAAGGADPSFAFEVQESDDNDSFTAVDEVHLQGAAPVITEGEECHRIGYVGSKRYLRVAISEVDGTTPTLACAAGVVRGDPYVGPL